MTLRSAFLLAMIAAIMGYAAPRSRAEVYYFPEGTDFDTIQTALSNHDNEVYLGEGIFAVPYPPRGNSFNVKARIFQGAGIDKTFLKNAAPLEPGALIMRIYGSDIDISGFTLTEAGTGFIVKAEDGGKLLKYHGINIRVKFEGLHNCSGIWENSPHDVPVTKPSVNILSSLLHNSYGFARSDPYDYGYTDRSPFIGIDQFTGNRVLGDFLIDAFVVNEKVVGSDYLTKIAMIDSDGIVVKDLMDLMDSPTDLAQLRVTRIYTGGTNCFEAYDNEFVPGTDIPKRDSRLNLGSGKYIGLFEPHHDLPGNLDFDEDVDFVDLAVAAKRYDGNDLSEVIDVVYGWLIIEPNDPNGNPK